MSRRSALQARRASVVRVGPLRSRPTAARPTATGPATTAPLRPGAEVVAVLELTPELVEVQHRRLEPLSDRAGVRRRQRQGPPQVDPAVAVRRPRIRQVNRALREYGLHLVGV